MDLDAPLTLRVPKAAAKKLAEGGFETVGDLIHYAPLRYYQWGRLSDISELEVGEHATILAQVVSSSVVQNRSGKGVRLVVQVTDGLARLTCTFFAKNAYMLSHHQRLLRAGATALISGKVSEYRGSLQIVQPEFEEIEEGSEIDVARRAGRPIPIYRAIAGLPSWRVSALINSLLDGLGDDGPRDQILPDDVRTNHALFTHDQAIRMLHMPQSPVDWQTAQRTLAWEEALVLQTALLGSRTGAVSVTDQKAPRPYSEGQSPAPRAVSFATDQPDSMMQELIHSLPFELTDAQKRAWDQISLDLSQTEPMQRLLQGDVGSGKTIIALLSMLSATQSGLQAAMLAPTEVLARQHWSSITKMIDDAKIDIPVHLLTSKRAVAEKNQALASLQSGEPSIVVGTHALLQDAVAIPNLGLVVVDEQHRFGVAQREELRTGRSPLPHLLVMTATPIPRTIAMTVFGDLDVTAMAELPKGRKPVQTFLVDERNHAWVGRMWQRAREEVDRGGRVYVVCPRIEGDDPEDGSEDSDQPSGRRLPAAKEVVEHLRGLEVFDGVEIGLAHGRARPEENAAAFAAFANGTVPVLVATTVVEVGVDVPEATMMVVLDGTRFGLSQLHQLRGRVGRSDAPSVCMITHPGELSDTSNERLRAIADNSDGFALAEIDLRLRKEGNVLGKNQSGRVSDLQFLSVRRDAAVIASAREVASAILAADPYLSDHTALGEAARRRAGDELVWMERS